MKFFPKIFFASSIWLLIIFCAYGNQLPVPHNLIRLASKRGFNELTQSSNPVHALALLQSFTNQANLTYCVIASSVMILNAFQVAEPADPIYKPYKFFTQQDFFTPAVIKILPIDQVKKVGVTSRQLGLALNTFPLKAKVYYANDLTEIKFRNLLRGTVFDNNAYAIVNYFRPGLGEVGGGHMSPVAAYDAATDSFLILDVSAYKYPSVWVKAQNLWRAVDTYDKDAQAYRALIVVRKKTAI